MKGAPKGGLRAPHNVPKFISVGNIVSLNLELTKKVSLIVPNCHPAIYGGTVNSFSGLGRN